MEHQIIAPPAPLKRYVRYFWTLECGAAEESRYVLKILADRFPRLIIQHLEGRSAIRKADGEVLPAAFLGGVSTRPCTYHINGGYAHTGVSFYPHGLHRIFGTDAGTLTNAFTDLSDFCPHRLRERLCLAASRAERMALLARFLLDQLPQRGREDALLHERLLSGSLECPSVSLAASFKGHKLSERQLERKFKSVVGIPHSTYLRIVRFEKAFQRLQTTPFEKIQDIAYGLNYSDHSHFTREFKQFSGYTPKAFLAEQKSTEESTSFLVNDPGK
ncbi:MAG: helix-turn-helix transcriptional regulator [Cytophagales bacterium]|nr:helix-turn-helix transcriptional regulator [Cytophagales bacterium]